MSVALAEGQVYLQSYLAPFAAILARPDVTDLYVNAPGEIWAETLGGAVERHMAPGLTAAVLDRLARQIAAHSHQGVNRQHPTLSAALPGGERVQVVIPPATRSDLALAIRKHVSATALASGRGRLLDRRKTYISAVCCRCWRRDTGPRRPAKAGIPGPR